MAVASKVKIFNDQVTKYGGSLRAESGIRIIYQPLTATEQGGITNQSGSGSTASRAGYSSQANLIVQSFNIGVQRPLQTLFDLSSNYAFYVAGKVQSTVSLEKIVGPKGVSRSFYGYFGDVCYGAMNIVWFIVCPEKCSTFFANSGITTTGNTNDALSKLAGGLQSNVVEVQSLQLQGVTFAASVQNFLVTESCQMTGLDVTLKWVDSKDSSGARSERQMVSDLITTIPASLV
jgi:hypothetical protein